MKKHIRIFLAGTLVVAPLAITVYVLWSVGAWLDQLGVRLLHALDMQAEVYAGVGAAALLVAVYFVGLLTHVWLFRGLIDRMELLIARVPGVKVIYESIRDLLKLFGGAGAMGKAVEYRPPGTSIALLGILTNENPAAINRGGGPKRVAVYLPMAYMLGGPTIYALPEHLTELDMPVELALKIAATANVGAAAALTTPGASPAAGNALPGQEETKG